MRRVTVQCNQQLPSWIFLAFHIRSFLFWQYHIPSSRRVARKEDGPQPRIFSHQTEQIPSVARNNFGWPLKGENEKKKQLSQNNNIIETII